MSKRRSLPSRHEVWQKPRNWSIRAKIIAVLAIPLAALIVMWALATTVTLSPAADLLSARANVATIEVPIQNLIKTVQAERKASVVFMATGHTDLASLAAPRAATDTAVAQFAATVHLERPSALAQTRLTDMQGLLDGLPQLRTEVDRGTFDTVATLDRYSEVVSAVLLMSATLVTGVNQDLADQARALVGVTRVQEVLAEEDALIAGVLATGTVTPTDIVALAELVGTQHAQLADNLPGLAAADQQTFHAIQTSAGFTTLATVESQVLGGSASGASSWPAAYAQVNPAVLTFETTTADELADRSRPAALQILGNVLIAGVLGLVAVILTIYASIRMARSLIRRLAGLRQAAQELAVDRLPSVVERLGRGEQVDVTTEAPPLAYGGDEIGQVGQALNQVARTAVNSAIDEANVRRGLNEVFLNIARRSQTLLHRQLAILDRMERRAENPEELEDLFRVDHLSTRMRRHAEDLVILAGATPGRGWRNPVPIVDVVRGAVSEVEEYARVSIRPMPDLAVAGRSVGDVIHLLAELIENATAFSPPHTRVSIGGERVAHGFAIEIEDRGLGMPSDRIAEINQRLAEPPEFDPATSSQLGLFVVARLAARHGIRVQLRSSAYGGITAVALLPDHLVAGPADAPTTELDMVPVRQAVAAAPEEPTTRRLPSGRSAGGRRALAAPARPAAALPAASSSAGLVDEDDDENLPRRVRQEARVDSLETTMRPPTARTADEARATMSSFQAGFMRGRREADDEERGGNDADA